MSTPPPSPRGAPCSGTPATSASPTSASPAGVVGRSLRASPTTRSRRFAVAGDMRGRRRPGPSGAFPEATEFAGYRLMTSRLAGCAGGGNRARRSAAAGRSSRSRSLSTGSCRRGHSALAGTVQAALNELAEGSATNPLQVLRQLSRDAGPGPLARRDLAELPVPRSGRGRECLRAARMDAAGRHPAPAWRRSFRPGTTRFTIRAYGDARDSSGQVRARATCEAVVRRGREFVIPG